MIHLIIKYFIRFGQLEIPTIGQLKLSKKEAELKDSVLKAPLECIHFEQGQGLPTKQFYQYLSNALDISVDQATIQYEQFWHNKFKEDGVVAIGSMGTITKHQDNYEWNATFDSSIYYNDIEIEQPIYSEVFEEMPIEQNKDKWLLWAIVLTVFAVLAILFKQ